MDYKEEDIVKHWGLWDNQSNEWIRTSGGFVWATMCPRVAHVQASVFRDDWNRAIENGLVPEDEKNQFNIEVREVKP